MQETAKPSCDTQSSQKSVQNPSSTLDPALEERLQNLEKSVQRLDRLCDAIESLAASNFQLLEAILGSEDEQGNSTSGQTLDG